MKEETESLDALCRVVYRKTGLNLRLYKEKFLLRRIQVRLRATKKSDLAGYVAYLKEEKGELEKLILCLTIHVSTFFRNPSTFQAIREKVFPLLFQGSSTRLLRFWSVGCARGEEPYSLAILVSEFMAGSPPRPVCIEAVDVDARVLEAAKRAEFSAGQLKGVEASLSRKYFVKNRSYHLVPAVRGMVKFHRVDILMSDSGGEYDFVLCRNLLIYIERYAQEAILRRFHDVLTPGGFLVLGRTEVLVGPVREFFEVVDAKERIYRKAG